MPVMKINPELVPQVTPWYDPSQGSSELQTVTAAPVKFALKAFAHTTAVAVSLFRQDVL